MLVKGVVFAKRGDGNYLNDFISSYTIRYVTQNDTIIDYTDQKGKQAKIYTGLIKEDD